MSDHSPCLLDVLNSHPMKFKNTSNGLRITFSHTNQSIDKKFIIENGIN
jgi:hypothetical protein